MSQLVVEIVPECAVRRKPPSLVEQAYGRYEKTTEYVELPPTFLVRSGATIETRNWLAPVIYTFDQTSGALLVREVFNPAPRAVYTLEAIGGERIRKQAEIGIVYVFTKGVRVDLNTTATAYTVERIPVTAKLNWIKLRVASIPDFVRGFWRKYGVLDLALLYEDIKSLFRRLVRRVVPNVDFDKLVCCLEEVESKIRSELSNLVREVGLELEDLELDIEFSSEFYDFYFWHKVNEIPVEFSYMITLLRKLPEDVKKYSPDTVKAIVLALVSKHVLPEEQAEQQRRETTSK